MMRTRMPWGQWEQLPDHHDQRDSAKHARVMSRVFLKEQIFLDKLWQVAAVRFPSGDILKLDGHTRTWMVKNGALPAPPVVDVDIYDVKDEAESRSLFAAFDRGASAKSASDGIVGAFKAIGWAPASGYFGRGNGKTALLHACGFAAKSRQAIKSDVLTTYELITRWLPEIKTADHILHTATNKIGTIQAGIIAAEILSLKKHGIRAEAFWAEYFSAKANKINYGPTALGIYVGRRSSEKRLSGSGNTSSLTEVALTTLERHLRHEDIDKITQYNCAGYLDPKWGLNRKIIQVPIKQRKHEIEELMDEGSQEDSTWPTLESFGK